MFTALAFSYMDIESIKQEGIRSGESDLAGASSSGDSLFPKEQALFNLPKQDFEETQMPKKVGKTF